jgi:hypothetical protein
MIFMAVDTINRVDIRMFPHGTIRLFKLRGLGVRANYLALHVHNA